MTTDEPDLPSDAAFTSFLLACDPSAVVLDRAAHATDIELRMIGHTTGRAA